MDNVIPSRSEDLKIDFVDSPKGARIMILTGPLTLKTLFDFQQVSRQQSTHPMIIDIGAVPYMDSAGLGLLTNYFVAAQDENRKFLMACVSDRILSLLQMTKVDQVLKLYPSVEAAESAA